MKREAMRGVASSQLEIGVVYGKMRQKSLCRWIFAVIKASNCSKPSCCVRLFKENTKLKPKNCHSDSVECVSENLLFHTLSRF
jgi:hypothetical protein